MTQTPPKNRSLGFAPRSLVMTIGSHLGQDAQKIPPTLAC